MILRLTLVGCLTWSAVAWSLTDATEMPLAQWEKTVDAQPYIKIELASQLTERQRNLIESGFSTFSIMEIMVADTTDDGESIAAVYKIACTVKFDTWQERYDLARIDTTVQTSIVKTFDDYAARCLTANVFDKYVLKRLQPGRNVLITLRIDQISASKAGEIKEWLIRQQSGIMQGLFGHMLGELQLTERIDVTVKVPTQPGFKGS